VSSVLCFLLQSELRATAVKNFIRSLLKTSVPAADLPSSRDQTNVPPTGEKAMTSSTAGINQGERTFTQRIPSSLALPERSATDPAPESDEPSRSFIAVLLRCLSAMNV
jgi:hypothetical protein